MFFRRNLLLNVSIPSTTSANASSSTSVRSVSATTLTKRHLPSQPCVLASDPLVPQNQNVIVHQGQTRSTFDPFYKSYAGSSSSSSSKHTHRHQSRQNDPLPHFALQVLAATGGALSAKLLTDDSSLANLEEAVACISSVMSPPVYSIPRRPLSPTPIHSISPSLSGVTLLDPGNSSLPGSFTGKKDIHAFTHFGSSGFDIPHKSEESFLSLLADLEKSNSANESNPILDIPQESNLQLSEQDHLSLSSKDWALKTSKIEAKKLCMEGLLLLKSLSSRPSSTKQILLQALYFFEESARLGHIPAAYNAAVLLDTNADIPFHIPSDQQALKSHVKNEAMAETYYRQAAYGGHVEAQYRLALLQLEQLSRMSYLQSSMSPQERDFVYREALEWLQKAASNRHTEAQNLLGLIQSDSRVVYKTASDFFNEALDHEENGRVDEALASYQIAANATLDTSLQKDAYFNMAVLYQRREDFENAVVCFLKAADLGDTESLALYNDLMRS